MNEQAASIDVLRKLPLFHNLNETECRQIAEICRLVTFQPGDCVLEFGDQSQNLWILLDGCCEVIRPRDPDAPHGEGLTLNTLEPFSIFGEMSFFHKAPHSAHVVAQTAIKLVCIQRCDYDDLIRDGAWGAYKLAFNAVAILAERLRRMSDWVAQLTRSQPAAALAAIDGSNNHGADHHGSDHRASEWSAFRDRLFVNWNL
jgi:CRP-like cAMP-binding protein